MRAPTTDRSGVAQDDRGQQRRRHLGDRRPREAPHRLVDANGLDRRAVAIDEREVGRAMRGLDLGERRQRMAVRSDREQSESEQRLRDAGSSERSQPHYGATSMPGFGDSAKLSGAYIASTREGGSANRPGLFRRTVYSTTCLPRGMYS